VDDLAKFSESEVLKLHGLGKASMPKLIDALKTKGLSFKK
jgi:DNA-directed RNA polymerase alpha subunit